jgi:hypothetical protein
LASNSTVFRDMFELPNSEEEEVEMEEDEEVLGKILAYCYPGRVPRFDLAHERAIETMKVMEKYQVSSHHSTAQEGLVLI